MAQQIRGKEKERGTGKGRQKQIDKVFFFIFLEEENKKFPCLKALNIQFRYLKMFSTIITTTSRQEHSKRGRWKKERERKEWARGNEWMNERKFMNEIRRWRRSWQMVLPAQWMSENCEEQECMVREGWREGRVGTGRLNEWKRKRWWAATSTPTATATATPTAAAAEATATATAFRFVGQVNLWMNGKATERPKVVWMGNNNNNNNDNNNDNNNNINNNNNKRQWFVSHIQADQLRIFGLNNLKRRQRCAWHG